MNEFSAQEFAGMTVNERLHHSGLLEAFDKAIENREERDIRSILEEVFLTPENIDAIILSASEE